MSCLQTPGPGQRELQTHVGEPIDHDTPVRLWPLCPNVFQALSTTANNRHPLVDPVDTETGSADNLVDGSVDGFLAVLVATNDAVGGAADRVVGDQVRVLLLDDLVVVGAEDRATATVGKVRGKLLAEHGVLDLLFHVGDSARHNKLVKLVVARGEHDPVLFAVGPDVADVLAPLAAFVLGALAAPFGAHLGSKVESIQVRLL